MLVLKMAVRNILRHPRRSGVTAITVAIGTAALFIFSGFNTGIMNQYRENSVHARYGFGQVNTEGYREQVFEKPWQHWIKNSDEVLSKLIKIPNVTDVFPRVEFFALLSNGQINVSGHGIGIDGEAEAEFFNTMNIIDGTVLGPNEDGMVLGRGLAKALSVKPGDRVTVLANTIHGSLNGIDVIVTGIFHLGTKEMDDMIFQIQLPQAQNLLDTKRVENIALGLSSYESWDGVAKQIEARFPTLEATSFSVLDKIYYQHAVDWLDSQFNIIRLIILAVVLLGIFNTVSTAIMERTREIGTLRANGDSVKDILSLLGIEGFTLASAGALLGIAIVVLLNATLLRNGILMPPSPGITRQFEVLIELQPFMAVTAFTMGTITAVVATLFAGIRVARLAIGQALRAI